METFAPERLVDRPKLTGACRGCRPPGGLPTGNAALGDAGRGWDGASARPGGAELPGARTPVRPMPSRMECAPVPRRILKADQARPPDSRSSSARSSRRHASESSTRRSADASRFGHEAIAPALHNARDLPEEVSLSLGGHSGGGIRTRDLRVMSPTSCQLYRSATGIPRSDDALVRPRTLQTRAPVRGWYPVGTTALAGGDNPFRGAAPTLAPRRAGRHAARNRLDAARNRLGGPDWFTRCREAASRPAEPSR